ncbi:heme lyase subunit NrfE [Salmonella enterica subsp. arizonae]|uniref:Heme lyase subunit NrfE n=1 Tax=Salmonella enterica subsp. arizonae TaxID=59203 RepID=A0A379T171_SALER|nr:heme lyase subunit NrfE [Salmonella enterica subsp. arizonae]
MIYGLMGWGRLSVGAPYFNRVTLPFGLLMLVVIVLATVSRRTRSLHRQLPALLAHTGVFIFAAGIMVSSGSRHEISLNLSPGPAGGAGGLYLSFRASGSGGPRELHHRESVDYPFEKMTR